MSFTEVLKTSGQREHFSADKLYESIRHAGASKALARKIVDQLKASSRPGIRTDELRQLSATLLRQESPLIAARYELRNSVLDLGPSGYRFEELVAAVYEAHGYRTEVSQILEGKCIPHEIDVVASRAGERILNECKFRGSPGVRCDSKIALYVQARALDLRERENGLEFDEFRLVTNAKFTSQAIQYADCVGLGLLGWNHPPGQGLQAMVEEKALHPLTCLASLTRDEKNLLLRAGMLLCRTMADDETPLREIGLDDERIRLVQEEAQEIVRG